MMKCHANVSHINVRNNIIMILYRVPSTPIVSRFMATIEFLLLFDHD